MDHRLNRIIEECGEVVQAAAKINRFGKDNYNPDTEISNMSAFEIECADLVQCIADYFDIDGDVFRCFMKHKQEKIDSYKDKER